jgi:hypothetical protein
MPMFDLLQEYIAQHHQLHLPFIGTIGLEKTAARADFSNKMFYPPKEDWKLLNTDEGNDEALLHFISSKQNSSTWQAKEQLENFCRDLKAKVNQSAEIKFPGVGILKNDENGLLQLEVLVADNMLLKPVMAERVIRKDAAHTILVGDREKTNFEMNELLHSMEASKAQRWWAWAAAIFVFAAGMIVYNYSNNNWSSRASGNQQTVTPQSLPVHISSMFK